MQNKATTRPMLNSDRALIAILLENTLLKNTGQAFEDFFIDAGTTLWGADFVPWRPQGPLGDFKCDGYRASDRTVFQCYAPETQNPNRTLAKIEEDFAGARDHFGEKMQGWIFVHNQRKGLPAAAAMRIADLQLGHPGIAVETWTPNHLIQQILVLSDQKVGLLFPHLAKGQQLSDAVWELLGKIVAENRPAIADSIEVAHFANRLDLDEVLAQLNETDREVRRRLLGYSQWFDPAEKKTIIGKLIAFGFAEAVIEANAMRLDAEGFIRITSNHYLPANVALCQEAAETLMDEFLIELES